MFNDLVLISPTPHVSLFYAFLIKCMKCELLPVLLLLIYAFDV